MRDMSISRVPVNLKGSKSTPNPEEYPEKFMFIPSPENPWPSR